MAKNSVLIVNTMHESIFPELEKCGLKVSYEPDITREEILDIIGDYEGIIVRSKLTIDKEFFDRAKKLRFIGRAGAGMDQIDLEEVKSRNIAVFNAPEGNRDSLAEHTLALLLNLLCNVSHSNNEVKAGIWRRDENRGVELKSKTVGIVGFGYMGRAFSEKLIGLGCQVISYDIKPSLELPTHVRRVDWEVFIQECDIVSLHVSLTDKTKNMVNDEWINKFKKNIWIINTSRGAVLNLQDLNHNLDTGKILGAALDVLEKENFNSYSEQDKAVLSDFVKRNNTILTPHIGGWTEESYVRINAVLVSKIADFLLQNG